MNYINSTKRRQQNGQSAAVIRYDETDGGTPSVIAQGTGVLAERIIELARQHGVQMQEDEQLVQHLLDLDLGDNIPPQLYSVIAEVLLLIEEMGMKD
ncbi:EscU/YscU/HrcU family type III secretion system export apparatus switch protein [Rossellomorea sp. FS2]|uniref:EscU/YscU/HrcU family type III secretion system export apparatus switch protein n=1 Tax=Rossellomorea sp. FS2 TaxID=3391447 RepID=UPI003A4E6151